MSESLSLIACPHGVDERSNTALLSLLVVPRLQGAATLGAFPNLRNWPATLQRGPVEVTLSWAGARITVGVPTKQLQRHLWSAILPETAPVVDYTFDDHSGRLVVSYPALLAAAVVKDTYQRVALTSAARLPTAALVRRMTEDLQTGWGDQGAKQRDVLRRVLWETQQGQLQRLSAAPSSSDGGIPDLPTGTRAGQVAAAAALFHNAPQAEKPQLDLDTVLDVHRVLSALAAHPALMRALGLVLEVAVPLDGAGGAMPQPGQAYPTVAVERLTAAWEGAPPEVHGPPTAFRLILAATGAPVSFEPAPGDTVSATTADDPVVGGMLRLPAELFGLLALDVDGAMHKVAATAKGMPRPSGAVGLPALRSAGISLLASDRGKELLARIARAKELHDSLDDPKALRTPLTVDDLVRGYRLDVWSSADPTWRSLHRRAGAYRTEQEVSLPVDDEGFTQLGATSAAGLDKLPPGGQMPPPETDLRVHERLARWSGWSLSVPRPGRALNRSADPAHALDDDPSLGQALTPFKLRTDFSVPRGTLPRLRFGNRYRMRARIVDVAGNSVPPAADAADGTALPPDPTGFSYLRHEPVPAPVVVAAGTDFGTGGDLHRLVIRTRNSDPTLDAVATTEEDARHIAPPRASIRMAEHHGALDGLSGAEAYAVVQRDSVAPPAVEGGLQMAVGYVPDPLSRAAALHGLPGAADATLADTAAPAALGFRREADVDAAGASTAVVRFGSSWPDLEPFRLRIVEGSDPAQWDGVSRRLTVSLPKATSITVPLSSVVGPEDLALLEPWRWLREVLEKAEGAALGGGDPPSLVGLGAGIAAIVRAALRGELWMLTPSRDITLVHAVQQPLRAPQFVSIQLSSYVAGIETEPDPLTGRGATLGPLLAERKPGATDALLLGGLRVHGASTAKVDIDATWSDIVDDPSQRYPWQRSTSTHVDEVHLHELDDHAIAADGAQSRYVGLYVASRDLVCFLDAAGRVGAFSGDTVRYTGDAAPLHRIGDTRHHRITYRATATTRFREYFEPAAAPAPGSSPPDDTPYIRAGDPVVIDVPSSSLPHAPQVLDVLPTFGWDRQATTDVRASVRRGRGLRVYLKRPWFSSGDGEMLGVVLWDRDTPPSADERHVVAPFVTQWGLDPIWSARSISAMPSVNDFEGAVTATGLSVPRLDLSVGVAGFPVEFDPDRGLWFADVVFATTEAYTPMVRLALARYQPHSIAGAELSPVVLADVAQFLPDRSVVVTTDPLHPSTARVVVSGVAPDGPRRNTVELTVQQRRTDFAGELAWEDVPVGTAQLVEIPESLTGGAALWAGVVRFAEAPAPDTYRLLVREYENLPVDPPPLGVAAMALRRAQARETVGRRVVFAEHIPLGPPVPGSDDRPVG